MLTFTELISLYGSDDDLASGLAAVGVKDINGEMVRKWRSRNSIPPAYWYAFIRACRAQRKYPLEINADVMVKTAAGKK